MNTKERKHKKYISVIPAFGGWGQRIMSLRSGWSTKTPVAWLQKGWYSGLVSCSQEWSHSNGYLGVMGALGCFTTYRGLFSWQMLCRWSLWDWRKSCTRTRLSGPGGYRLQMCPHVTKWGDNYLHVSNWRLWEQTQGGPFNHKSPHLPRQHWVIIQFLISIP